jgi:ubiquinone/menaquinone biosynthesis C-methylase UbiE
MVEIQDLICCPKCHGDIDSQMSCSICGEQYSIMDGIPNMVSETLSAGHWKWNPRFFEESEDSNETNADNLGVKYSDFINDASKQANVKHWTAMKCRIKKFRGIVCDLATRMGGMLRFLLNEGNGFDAIATDVDVQVLRWDKKNIGKEFHAVATDGRFMAFKDGVFDCITSHAGLGNIPETPKVIRELHRVLKPAGTLVIMATFADEGTKSHELAVHHNLAFTEKAIVADLAPNGFKDIHVDIVASAVWAENPFDLLPAAGDTQHYAIITARK